jgi:hypothetical protein
MTSPSYLPQIPGIAMQMETSDVTGSQMKTGRTIGFYMTTVSDFSMATMKSSSAFSLRCYTLTFGRWTKLIGLPSS